MTEKYEKVAENLRRRGWEWKSDSLNVPDSVSG